ncbi:hypothetical protein CGZ93_09915 [Enemella dayhoffiae]|uniref:Uncharacterized protein n=1 Tax=Enemella dayhoffiae TaxID=2016507 RepID=A0A255H1N9_9ACTN|nr:hypothetical protein CGZ93_09915 [Enemella dayhoffiae]
MVVSDFIRWAKENGIRVGPGRGSGAGSMCAYAMKITDLDPIPHGLIFERFLNPERKSMPDFDVDFDDRRRPEVIRYVTEKYGSDKVAMIVTYGTIKAKQAVKEAISILDKPKELGDRITETMPPTVFGRDVPLRSLFDKESRQFQLGKEFRALCDSDPEVKHVVATAAGIENLKRQWGVHASGLVLANTPLIDIVPMMARQSDGAIITQFDYPTCGTLGLVKFDFLGVRNLRIIDDALRTIETTQGVTVDLDALGRNPTDRRTYQLLSRGDTIGVFGLAEPGMRDLLRLLGPDSLGDISAALALYRPGSIRANAHIEFALRKHGKKERIPFGPQFAQWRHLEVSAALEPILRETHGLLVYQEQVMTIAQQLAGYTLGSADLLRRAMGKKKREVLDAEFVNFEAGMIANGFPKESVKALWDALLLFSHYAFNKAHTAAYGLVSYWTAYLKANYPTEYMAAERMRDAPELT